MSNEINTSGRITGITFTDDDEASCLMELWRLTAPDEDTYALVLNPGTSGAVGLDVEDTRVLRDHLIALDLGETPQRWTEGDIIDLRFSNIIQIWVRREIAWVVAGGNASAPDAEVDAWFDHDHYKVEIVRQASGRG